MLQKSVKDVLVFKTNIRLRKQIEAVRRHFEAEPNILKWNVDLNDRDKVLRIESLNLHPGEVEVLVQNAGYFCKELED